MTLFQPDLSNASTEIFSQPSQGSGIYEGLDFANHELREGRAFLVDDGTNLTVSFERPDVRSIKRIGVDCPFGTSAEFYSLLSGILPSTSEDRTFQSRSTERWVRRVIGKEYRSCKLWDASARREFDRDNYFHPTTHVQPAVAMRIVPNCLAWLIRQIEDGISPTDFVLSARQADGLIVEAHPRMFLYSMIERIHRANAGVMTARVMNSIAGYKNKGKVSNRERREDVYHFLRNHTEWTGKNIRRLQPEHPNELLFASDHAFDAWLSALTAWAHHHQECIRWDEAGISPEAVKIEGHILILRQVQAA